MISIILPAKNEETGLGSVLPALKSEWPEAEIIVVDDGSTDSTPEVCDRAGVIRVSNPYSMGNGAAIKRGARAARGDVLVFMDADGQHAPADIRKLLQKLDEGYDLVVGARTSFQDQASVARWGANTVYNMLASWMVGHPVLDLTSGFRAVRRDRFLSILNLLPNGFSYPTTSTMAFYRAALSIAFVPINVAKRPDQSVSHIRPLRDGMRFLTIIFKVATLYAPLKIFAPASLALFFSGLGYYIYTFVTTGRFTNMGTVLFISALFAMLIGLLSEQITTLLYHRNVDWPQADGDRPTDEHGPRN